MDKCMKIHFENKMHKCMKFYFEKNACTNA